MKKLEKLKLHNLEEICVDEQRSIKGGGEWITGPDGNQYWYVGEVEIIAQNPNEVPPPCPACEIFHNANNHQPSMGVQDENPALSGWGELFFNTIPHLLGWWGHTSGSETEFRISLDGGKTWVNPNDLQPY